MKPMSINCILKKQLVSCVDRSCNVNNKYLVSKDITLFEIKSLPVIP